MLDMRHNMRHRMRRQLKMRVTIPKLSTMDSWDVASYLAKKYSRSTTMRSKRDVLETLLILAPNWDGITRSICYYNLFEEWTDTHFDVFWGIVHYNRVVEWLNEWESGIHAHKVK